MRRNSLILGGSPVEGCPLEHGLLEHFAAEGKPVRHRKMRQYGKWPRLERVSRSDGAVTPRRGQVYDVRKKLVAGNWKMNGLGLPFLKSRPWSRALRAFPGVDLAICPPATLAGAVEGSRSRDPISDWAGRTAMPRSPGRYTGDISAEMWADAGAGYVIVGHSERRTLPMPRPMPSWPPRLRLCYRAGLTPIICIGESLAERDSGRTLDVIATQLGRFSSGTGWPNPCCHCLRACLGYWHGPDADHRPGG
jgi:hypothetical protein